MLIVVIHLCFSCDTYVRDNFRKVLSFRIAKVVFDIQVIVFNGPYAIILLAVASATLSIVCLSNI